MEGRIIGWSIALQQEIRRRAFVSAPEGFELRGTSDDSAATLRTELRRTQHRRTEAFELDESENRVKFQKLTQS
jgi:hypothetical protein